VPPRLHRIGRQHALLALAALVVASACGGAPSFAIHACTDGYVRNTEPELEALLPTTFDGQAATTSSGRNCKPENLGSLVEHGVSALRYAGATWDFGSGTAVTMAIEAIPDATLPVAWIEEFYEIGARTGRRTSDVTVSHPTLDSLGEVYRLDVLNDLSLQTIVIWQDGERVRDILVATQVSPTAVRADHDALVDRALATAVSSAR